MCMHVCVKKYYVLIYVYKLWSEKTKSLIAIVTQYAHEFSSTTYNNEILSLSRRKLTR